MPAFRCTARTFSLLHLMHWSSALAASTPVGLMLQRWRSKFQARYGFVEADTSERAARHSPKREPRPKLGNPHRECIEGI